MMKPIDMAIELAGGQTALGKILGKRQSHVFSWKKRGYPPADMAVKIEAAVGGKVTRHQLRPDVFGTDSLPGAE